MPCQTHETIFSKWWDWKQGTTAIAQWKQYACLLSRKVMLKAKNKLRELTRRNRGQNVRKVMGEVKRCMTGWLNYYAIASMKQRMQEWDEWLRRRIRTYIWKQWKKPRIKFRNLIKLGVPECFARMVAYSGRGYWFTEKTRSVTRATTNERLIRTGYFELSLTYESIQTAYIGRAVCLTVRRGLVTQCY